MEGYSKKIPYLKRDYTYKKKTKK